MIELFVHSHALVESGASGHVRVVARIPSMVHRAWQPDYLGLQRGRYTYLTLHRPSNVDDFDVLKRLLGVPCLTLRFDTERFVTEELGTSELVCNAPSLIR